jgi:hypothetical protein
MTPEAQERRRMQPALFHAAEVACANRLTDGFCTPKNVAYCRCWDAAEAIMQATGLSGQSVAWIFRNTTRIEALSQPETSAAPSTDEEVRAWCAGIYREVGVSPELRAAYEFYKANYRGETPAEKTEGT